VIEYVKLSHSGVLGIRSIPSKDSRGDFLRVLDIAAIQEKFEPSEISIATNMKAGTLRGMHYQTGDMAEAKMIFCLSGKVFDVGVDLRTNSQSYLSAICMELGPTCEFQGLFLPANYAHGYVTLQDQSKLIYVMDKPYSPNQSSGYMWNDNAFQIPWPIAPTLISEKDQCWKAFRK